MKKMFVIIFSLMTLFVTIDAKVDASVELCKKELKGTSKNPLETLSLSQFTV